jgi:hypothetical protein
VDVSILETPTQHGSMLKLLKLLRQETRDFKTIKDDSKYNQRNSCVKTLNVFYSHPI